MADHTTDCPLIAFAVKALIIRDGSFLALHRTGEPSPRYELPGGRMCFGETAEETIKREVLEETGLCVKPLRLLDTWNYLAETRQITGIIYLCAETDKTAAIVTLSAAHDRYEWLPADSGFLRESLVKMSRLFAPQMARWDWSAVCVPSEPAAAIVPVTESSKQDWAALCTSLWPQNTAEKMLAQWTEGGYDNEYLYTLNGEAAAFISLSVRRDYVEGTDTSPVGYVEGIYVRPAYRNRGIARALIAFAKEWSRARGCTELASDCEWTNAESRLFHRRVGFVEANTIICFTMDIGTDLY